MTDQPQPVDLSTLIESGQVQAPAVQLSQADKEALAEEGTPFTINSIIYGDDGEFGPYFQFEATLNGKPVSFRIGSNEKRDSFLDALANITAKQPVSGVRLRAIGTRGGNKFLTVEPA